MGDQPIQQLVVGTLNLRNTSDRWQQRWPLMRDQIVSLQPDILGLQELRRPSRQRSMIVHAVNTAGAHGTASPPYRIVPAYKTGILQFWEGIAVLTRAVVVDSARLDLRSGNRVAQRVTVEIGRNTTLDVYNTHLDHALGNDDVRSRQAEHLLDWVGQRGDRPAILVGDFNSQPSDRAIQLILGRFRSAYATIHGREPRLTVPTPLSANWGKEEKVLDYIFVNERVQVHDAWVTFDIVDPKRRLAASDHYGLAARISFG